MPALPTLIEYDTVACQGSLWKGAAIPARPQDGLQIRSVEHRLRTDPGGDRDALFRNDLDEDGPLSRSVKLGEKDTLPCPEDQCPAFHDDGHARSEQARLDVGI